MLNPETGSQITIPKYDLSWLASSEILRWKSWFYQGLIPALAQRGPQQAGHDLEKISLAVQKTWPGRWRTLTKAVTENGLSQSPQQTQQLTERLSRQILRYAARDCLLDWVKPSQWNDLFTVEGHEHIQEMTAQKQGYIILGSHLGGHLAGVHWMVEHGVPLRMLVQRPRHISRKLNHWFDLNHPICNQKSFFLKRDLAPAEAARRVTDARRLIHSGQAVYMNCDINWNGPNTNVCTFLGQPIRLQTIWIDLASILGCPVIMMDCRQLEKGRFAIRFEPPFTIHPHDQRQSIFTKAISRLENKILTYPDDAVAHLTWSLLRPERNNRIMNQSKTESADHPHDRQAQLTQWQNA